LRTGKAEKKTFIYICWYYPY